MTISHVELNAPLTGTKDEQAVELYHLRRQLAAFQHATALRDVNPNDVEVLVNLATNKHRNSDGFILTVDDLVTVVRLARMNHGCTAGEDLPVLPCSPT